MCDCVQNQQLAAELRHDQSFNAMLGTRQHPQADEIQPGPLPASNNASWGQWASSWVGGGVAPVMGTLTAAAAGLGEAIGVLEPTADQVPQVAGGASRGAAVGAPTIDEARTSAMYVERPVRRRGNSPAGVEKGMLQAPPSARAKKDD